jgi:hypothetical protein
MNEKSKAIIKEEMLALPKEVRGVIELSNWEKISEEIGKKHLLNEDEIETLQLETACLLLGLVDENSYLTNIENEAGTSREGAKKISGEIFEKIFEPIDSAITENIKRSGKDKSQKPDQTIDFILSGGDYSNFLEERPASAPTDLPKTNAPVKPRTIADIKSKFTV